MKNKKIIELAKSFVILPIITISMPFGGLPKINSDIVLSPQAIFFKQNTEVSDLFSFNQEVDQKTKTLELQADAIDAYFIKYDMPLVGYGLKFAEEAAKNEIDYRLLAAISVIETTGGKHMCKNPKAPNNPFGWGSCRFGFKSIDNAIETVARNLGGNNPRTAHHYSEKETKEILEAYNPPSIVPNYASKVMKVMGTIGPEVFTTEANS